MTFVLVASKMTKFIKVFKTAKLLKPVLAFGSLCVSVFAYSFALGLWFSVGFVVMLLIHELGHVAALKRKGFRTSVPVFIPFLGAVIFAPEMGDRDDEAYIGLAGPLIGGLAALGLLAVTVVTDASSELLVLVTFTAFVINAFNLIPISPLDGGRVTQAVGPWFKYVGGAMLLVLTVALQAPDLLLIWLMVLAELNIDARLRAWLSWGIYAAMLVMEVLGIGHPVPWPVILLDAILGLFFVGMAHLQMKFPNEYVMERDERKQLPIRRRLYWLCLYAGLTIALVSLTIWSITYLPAEALG